MKAAVITKIGEGPQCMDFAQPVAGEGEVLVNVAASGLSPLTRMRALGRHYTTVAPVPFVIGVDGVGRLSDNQRVFFLMPRSPFGGMAEQTIVARNNCVPIPDGLVDERAAAIANPGVSSWAALTQRTQLRPDMRVLINGATGASGFLAVQVAKHLGAGEVIATGRNQSVLNRLSELGADLIVPLQNDEEALEKALGHCFDEGIDVVLDYLWGASAEMILKVATRFGASDRPIRFVQVGEASGGEIRVRGANFRSSSLELCGSGFGSVSMAQYIACTAQFFEAAAVKKFELDVAVRPLRKVAEEFARPNGLPRVVLVS